VENLSMALFVNWQFLWDLWKVLAYDMPIFLITIIYVSNFLPYFLQQKWQKLFANIISIITKYVTKISKVQQISIKSHQTNMQSSVPLSAKENSIQLRIQQISCIHDFEMWKVLSKAKKMAQKFVKLSEEEIMILFLISFLVFVYLQIWCSGAQQGRFTTHIFQL
jgi:hypothetical protein